MPVLHTAADDLESFLLVLVWVVISILKTALPTQINEGTAIGKIEGLFSAVGLDGMARIEQRQRATMKFWPDIVFAKLIDDWATISVESEKVLNQFEKAASSLESQNNLESQIEIWDNLDNHCRDTYKRYLQTGYHRLRYIRTFSDWNAVIASNGERLSK